MPGCRLEILTVSRYPALPMKVLAFVSSKGGSGKSTLAACIAVAAAGAGRTVILVDTDAQGSLAAWGKRRVAQDLVHRSVDSRVAYADALAEGTGVTESDPRGRAAEEIGKLWEWGRRGTEGVTWQHVGN